VPRLRTSGALPPLVHTSSWRSVWLSTGYGFTAWYLVKHSENFTCIIVVVVVVVIIIIIIIIIKTVLLNVHFR
jgi:membrane protein DedA with SNARE-associated domain